MAYLYLSGQQGLVQHQLINRRQGSPAGFPVQEVCPLRRANLIPDISGNPIVQRSGLFSGQGIGSHKNSLSDGKALPVILARSPGGNLLSNFGHSHKGDSVYIYRSCSALRINACTFGNGEERQRRYQEKSMLTV